jgi:hypothetical protein
MKKLIAGLVVGHILTNCLYLYLDGGVERAQFLIGHLKEHPEDGYHFPEMVEYLMMGDPKDPSKDDPAVEAWIKRIKLIRAMAAEGYSVAEISDQLNLTIALVQEVLDTEVKSCP